MIKISIDTIKNKLGGNLEITNIPIKPIKLISPWNYHNRL
jgi:hypothetical protein